MKVPEKYRIRTGQLGSDPSYGNNGAFQIPFSNRSKALVIASDGEGWEHVSVHIESHGESRTPTWREMCKIKDMFWDENETVIQYHPSKKEYVNMHPHVLHLWRPTEQEIPLPASIMVGLKDEE